VAFFRQFFASVTKVDYLTMRQGFINAHLSPNAKFDFQKYIKRSLEDDFKVVVGIRSVRLVFSVNSLHVMSFVLWAMADLDTFGWFLQPAAMVCRHLHTLHRYPR
jgi:hypothetical protein